MNSITNFLKINVIKYLPKYQKLPVLTGRWKIETCNRRLNRKVDLSNEDHCGPCGKYILEKLENANKIDKTSSKPMPYKN